MTISEFEAREILGVSEFATFKEIKKAHRNLVNVFHPDRAEKDLESQKRATESMTRINLAWSVIEERERAGNLGAKENFERTSTSNASWKFSARRPGKSECGICGSAPSEYFNITGIAVLIISIAWPGYKGNLCKACAKAFAHEALRTSMIRGWWGIWFFLTPFIILKNLLALRKISQMPEPTYRDFRVVTPYEVPLLARPNPLKDVKAVGVMTFGIIAVVIALIISGQNPSTPSNISSPNSTTSSNCWTLPDSNQLYKNVYCSDPGAYYQEISTTQDSTACPLGTVVELNKNSMGLYTCLGLKQ